MSIAITTLLLLLSLSVVLCYKVNTIAGVANNYGDGNMATKSSINPYFVTTHPLTQEIYILDGSSSQIKKISTTGTISTVAGKNGVSSFNGDGNLATETYLSSPSYMVITPKNEIIFSDFGNSIIRKIFANGTVATIVGTPKTSGYSPDGTIATQAVIRQPYGLAYNVDTDELYFVEQANHAVRKLLNGRIYTVAGGTGSPGNIVDVVGVNARFRNPSGLFFSNSSGALYVVDSFNHAIKKIDLTDANNMVTTVAGNVGSGFSGDGSSATTAQLNNPKDISFTNNNNMYIADFGNNAIRKVDANGIISTVVGDRSQINLRAVTVTANQTNLGSPNSISCYGDESACFVAEQILNVVSKYTPSTNQLTVVAGNGPQGYGYVNYMMPSTVAAEVKMLPVKVRPYKNSLIIADSYTNLVRRVSGTTVSTIAGVPTAWDPNSSGGMYNGENLLPLETNFNGVYGVFVNGTTLFIVDIYNHVIRKMPLEGSGNVTIIAGIPESSGSAGDNGPATSAQLSSPQEVFVVGDDVYICDTSNHAVRKVDANGVITTVAGQLGRDGYDGDNGPATSALLNYPNSIFVTSEKEIYIADTVNTRVRKVFTNGTIITVAGSGSSGDGNLATSARLVSPNSVFFKNGELLIGDGSAVRKVNTTGYIETVVGESDTYGFTADGNMVSTILFNSITDVWMLDTNELLVTDANNVVRKISRPGTPVPQQSTNLNGVASVRFNILIAIMAVAMILLV